MFGSAEFRERVSIVLLMVVLISYHTSGWQLFSLVSMGFTLADAFVVIAILFMTYRIIIHNDSILWSRTVLYPMIVLFLISVCTSSIMPIMSGNSSILIEFTKAYFHELYFFVFLLGSVLLIRKKDTFLTIVKQQVFCSIVVNLYGIYQVPARFFDLPLSRVVMNNRSMSSEDYKYGIDTLQLGFEGFFRATSFYSEPSSLAAFNSIILAFLLVPYLLFDYRIIKNAYLYAATLGLCVIALFMTLSNTAFFQATVLLLFLYIFGEKKHRRKFIASLVILGSILFVADHVIESYSTISVANMYIERVGGILMPNKFEGMGGESFGYRANELQKGFNQWKSYPILGTGLNTSEFFPNDYSVTTPYANNTYMDALLMLGIGGGLAYVMIKIGMVAAALHAIWFMRRNNQHMREYWILATILLFFAVRLCIEGISSDTLSDGGSWYTNGWWLIGYMELRRNIFNDGVEYRFFKHGLAHYVIQALYPPHRKALINGK